MEHDDWNKSKASPLNSIIKSGLCFSWAGILLIFNPQFLRLLDIEADHLKRLRSTNQKKLWTTGDWIGNHVRLSPLLDWHTVVDQWRLELIIQHRALISTGLYQWRTMSQRPRVSKNIRWSEFKFRLIGHETQMALIDPKLYQGKRTMKTQLTSEK